MAEKKQTESTSKEESQTTGFKFPFGNCEDMFNMMSNCCGSDKNSFDCCAKMQQMWGGTPKEKEADKQ